MSLRLLSYFRTKCLGCGRKFTVTNEANCSNCSHLGINCHHGRICMSCIEDKIFFGALVAIFFVAWHGIGVMLNAT